jgi:outer membrane protein assembly factor BamB
MLIPFTLAQTEAKINMTANLWAGPDPVGVGQTMLIEGCLYPRPAFSGGQFGDIYRDIEVTITEPDGTTDTRIIDSDDRAEFFFNYVPDQVGEYTVYMNWEGDDLREDDDDTERFIVQQDPVPPLEKILSFSYVSTMPKSLIGQGQWIYIVGWVSPPPELSGRIYRDLEFVVTKPDGSKVTEVKDTASEATASYALPCDQTGTWSVVLNFPGDRIYLPSTSKTWSWTVQAEPVPGYPDEPLPNPNMDWDFPISGEYKEWFQISGSWWGPRGDYATNFNPYSTAPNTPHVIWKKEMDAGGIIGGETGHESYVYSEAPTCVAAHGRLYYTENERWIDEEGTGRGHPVMVCLDMETGEEIFRRDLPGDGAGSILAIEESSRLKVDPKLGVRPSEVFSVWAMRGGLWEVDGWTGECLYYNPDLPGGLLYDGHIFSGNTPSSGYCTKWSTRDKEIVWEMPSTFNVIPYATNWASEGMLVDRNSRVNGMPPYGDFQVWSADTGELITNYEGSYEIDDYPAQGGWGDVCYQGKLYRWAIDGQVHCYDMRQGVELWVSEQKSENPWGIFGAYTASAAYDKVYFQPWDGYIYANDANTGKLEWSYYCGDSTEVAAGHNVPWGVLVIADDKVFFQTGEHTTPNPPPRGNMLYCLNAHTGEELWTFPMMYRTRSAGIHDGKLWFNDRYDGCMYMFGKGPSATSVTASPKVVAKGSSILIEGTVLDQSPGAEGYACVSKDSMADWMEHIYRNKPEPADTVGVPVLLQACSSSGSVIDIGVVTSDMKGCFEHLWTPPDEDTYKILATFTGDESYYMSWAETAVGVTEAPPTPTNGPTNGKTEPEPTGFGTTELAIIAAAVIIAIVALVVAFWALRKRQ